jgi:hypothetical protein
MTLAYIGEPEKLGDLAIKLGERLLETRQRFGLNAPLTLADTRLLSIQSQEA